MKIIHKIIAVLNLLILAAVVFSFIDPNFPLKTVDLTLSTALILLIMLVSLFWGVMNYIGFLGGYPVDLDQLSTFEKALAFIPLLNFIIIASIIFLLFMFS